MSGRAREEEMEEEGEEGGEMEEEDGEEKRICGALLFPIASAIAQRVVKELLHFHKCTARSTILVVDTTNFSSSFGERKPLE